MKIQIQNEFLRCWGLPEDESLFTISTTSITVHSLSSKVCLNAASKPCYPTSVTHALLLLGKLCLHRPSHNLFSLKILILSCIPRGGLRCAPCKGLACCLANQGSVLREEPSGPGIIVFPFGYKFLNPWGECVLYETKGPECVVKHLFFLLCGFLMLLNSGLHRREPLCFLLTPVIDRYWLFYTVLSACVHWCREGLTEVAPQLIKGQIKHTCQ